MKLAARTTARLTLFVMVGLCAGGCASRDNVKVRDALTGKPIAGATVMPIYPSFSGAACQTDAAGRVHVGGLGLPRGGFGVEVTAPGYEKYFFSTYPTAQNPSGWNENNLDLTLQPIVRP